MLDRAFSLRSVLLLLLVTGGALLARIEVRADDAKSLERIEAARLKGAKALAERWAKSKDDHDTWDREHGPYYSLAPLVALALRRGDPAHDELAKEVLDGWWLQADKPGANEPDLESETLYRVYQYSEALAVCALHAPGEKLPEASQRSCERLAKALTTAARPQKEGRTGLAWGQVASLHDLVVDDTLHEGDAGGTLAAVLGLRDAARAGVAVDVARLERVAVFYIETPWKDGPRRGEWHRETNADRDGPAPTTAGAVAALAALAEIGCKDERIAPAIEKGRAALVKLARRAIGAATAPKQPHLLRELALGLDGAGVASVDSKDWFVPLATKLVAAQKPTGLWNDSVADTSAALLFLSREGRRAGAPTTTERPTAP